MLDPKLLRTALGDVASNLARRGFVLETARYETLEKDRKTLQVEVEQARSERNAQSKAIGQAKAVGEDITPLREAVEKLGDELKRKERLLQQVQESLSDLELDLPNLLHESVPDGDSEKDNLEVRRWGETTTFDFSPKDHVDLGEQIGGIDFETASQLSGSRFVTLSGAIAQLHRALGQFMLDVQTQEHGYKEHNLPLLVGPKVLQGTGQLPKFAEDLFPAGEEHYLIPTSEVTLANLVREQILPADELPRKVTALTPCFRS
ncbi:MAG: serine--tRNA ligase, partial [Gammaproteobacteria bacterium]|nr:serine--tRNA ligase [Gammaproteobacteria bacterium]